MLGFQNVQSNTNYISNFFFTLNHAFALVPLRYQYCTTINIGHYTSGRMNRKLELCGHSKHRIGIIDLLGNPIVKQNPILQEHQNV
ncbi:hypothetical protein AQUCO_03600117v1 [Aquilegia coerulea]|uniref:Uncharacterized protein n=1 Tax=Aquilegia coerulea TaxID=218851 RepID=A0A2G5CVA6_AQUCA|nr:hypothetical protein AQUCO_03600117v1 [Aquilegia coerulea]